MFFCFLGSTYRSIHRERSACVTIFQISKSHDMDRKTKGQGEWRKTCFLRFLAYFPEKTMLK